MRKIFLAILLVISFSTKSQHFGWSKLDSNDYKWTVDTIKVRMLLSDTTYLGYVHWRNGYVARELPPAIPYLDWQHYPQAKFTYLDSWKQPLPGNIIVWITKERP